MPLSVRARRVGYRLAYRVLQVVWFLFRPEVSGVKCLITHGNESFRNDIIYCFETALASPSVSPDPVELATARWFTRGTLPAELARYVRPVLAGTSAD